PICIIDYPFGISSLDVRTYSLHSVKEKGAKEVEIVAPYHFIKNKDFKKLQEDVQSIVTVAKKINLSIKYVVDQNNPIIDDTVRTRINRIIGSSGINSISTSLGFFDKSTEHGDNVLRMRNIKNKIG